MSGYPTVHPSLPPPHPFSRSLLPTLSLHTFIPPSLSSLIALLNEQVFYMFSYAIYTLWLAVVTSSKLKLFKMFKKSISLLCLAICKGHV